MAETTAIAWTDSTFNPWMGCTRVSPGCGQGGEGGCYAEKSPAVLFRGIKWGPGQPRVRTSAANWKKPLAWNRAAERAGERRRVFCASLADVFDPEAPRFWLADLAALIEATPALDWLLLTKRPEHFSAIGSLWSERVDGPWPRNVWLGVTVENQEQAERRIPLLLAQPAAVRFLSCEPLLGPLDLSAFIGGPYVSLPGDHIEPNYNAGIGWVIVGGESGPKARPFNVAWARSLRDQCKAAQVPYFFKQAGANPRMDFYEWADHDLPMEGGPIFNGGSEWDPSVDGQPPPGCTTRLHLKDSHGGDLDELPDDLNVRQFPTPTPRSTT